mgnify:CR=1 FL=1
MYDIRNDLMRKGLSENKAKLYTIHSFRYCSVTDMTGTDEEKIKRGGNSTKNLYIIYIYIYCIIYLAISIEYIDIVISDKLQNL